MYGNVFLHYEMVYTMIVMRFPYDDRVMLRVMKLHMYDEGYI